MGNRQQPRSVFARVLRDGALTPSMWFRRAAQYSLVGERLPLPSQLHSHHALQLTVSLDGPLHVIVGSSALPPVWGVLLGPSVPHTLFGDVVHIFVEPLEPLGRRLRGMLRGRPALALERPLVERFLAGVAEQDWLSERSIVDTDEPVLDLIAELARVHGPNESAPVDERIANVISLLRGQLVERVPLELLADVAHLSPTRLTHLFTREVGLPIKQYVVWLRLVAVLESLGTDRQLGTLAHATGFPDQPAFARSYRRAWGRTPNSFRQAAGLRDRE